MQSWEADIRNYFQVPPGKPIRLKDYDPGWSGNKKLSKEKRKQQAEIFLREDVEDLIRAQELLWASDRWALLIILQGMDTSGKDGIIKHVMSGVNPQGCQVHSFKKPTEEELDHDFLWRCVKVLPERGRIGIFNRSYYEEVLVVKVHPEILQSQRLPTTEYNEDFWKARYESINRMEHHLARNGTAIVKLFLHISKEEQRKRLLARLEDPAKHWKFSIGDLAERGYWEHYMKAYEEMVNFTTTEWAPWYIIPSDHKWVARAVAARIITNVVDTLALEYPQVNEEQRAKLAEAKILLSK